MTQDIRPHVLITVDTKGKTKNVVTGISIAMLKLYAMNHESEKRSHIIINSDTYTVEAAFLWGKLPKDNDMAGKPCTDYDIPKDVIDTIVDTHNR